MARKAVSAPLLLLTSGCVIGLGPALDSLSEVADRLVSAVEKRTDVGRLRVLVYEIHPMKRNSYRPDSLGSVLEHEFVLHLSEHLNIVESEHGGGNGGSHAAEADLKKAAETHRANAVLAGDYVQIGGDVYVSVRIIDVESMVVIGAARGVLGSNSLRRLAGTRSRRSRRYR